jgi:serine/threonine protein kinase
MAPEITEGNTYSEKADIWSLGIFLHILIAGKSPFIMKALTGKTV